MLIIAVMQMALFWAVHFRGKIIEYLLVDAWDIENCAIFQFFFWRNFLESVSALSDSWRSGDLDVSLQLSRRVSALGQVIHADIIHDIVRASTYCTFSTPAVSIYDDLFKFFINQGAEIECRGTFSEETALLVVAELDNIESLEMMPVLLRLDADYSAVDYKGRGPLHLALKQSRFYTQNLHSRTLKKKLIHLLRAGCSIHAIDHYGRTPTDVARKWGRTKAWKAALQELGKMECATLDCQCEIIVRLSPCLAIALPAAIDAKLTIAEDRTS